MANQAGIFPACSSSGVITKVGLVAWRPLAVAVQAEVVAPGVSNQVFARLHFDFPATGIVGVTKVAICHLARQGAMGEQKVVCQMVGGGFVGVMAFPAG